jgi:peptidoglycan/xylan/chitin deacetylase (PgdA/CDA1 family)
LKAAYNSIKEPVAADHAISRQGCDVSLWCVRARTGNSVYTFASVIVNMKFQVALLLLALSLSFSVSSNEETGEEMIPPPLDLEVRGTSLLWAGSPNRQAVALTFDDGPIPGKTDEILRILAENQALATFFLIGDKALAYPELVQRILLEGHEIGNHTQNHRNLTKANPRDVLKEVRSCQDSIEKAILIKPQLFRAPYGAANMTTFSVLSHLGLTAVFWSIDTRDWAAKKPETIREAVLGSVQNGDVILFHEHSTHTIAALNGILQELQFRGFALQTISQLFDRIPYGPQVPPSLLASHPASGAVVASGSPSIQLAANVVPPERPKKRLIPDFLDQAPPSGTSLTTTELGSPAPELMTVVPHPTVPVPVEPEILVAAPSVEPSATLTQVPLPTPTMISPLSPTQTAEPSHTVMILPTATFTETPTHTPTQIPPTPTLTPTPTDTLTPTSQPVLVKVDPVPLDVETLAAPAHPKVAKGMASPSPTEEILILESGASSPHTQAEVLLESPVSNPIQPFPPVLPTPPIKRNLPKGKVGNETPQHPSVTVPTKPEIVRKAESNLLPTGVAQKTLSPPPSSIEAEDSSSAAGKRVRRLVPVPKTSISDQVKPTRVRRVLNKTRETTVPFPVETTVEGQSWGYTQP